MYGGIQPRSLYLWWQLLDASWSHIGRNDPDEVAAGMSCRTPKPLPNASWAHWKAHYWNKAPGIGKWIYAIKIQAVYIYFSNTEAVLRSWHYPRAAHLVAARWSGVARNQQRGEAANATPLEVVVHGGCAIVKPPSATLEPRRIPPFGMKENDTGMGAGDKGSVRQYNAVILIAK
jgi:hypothetical protein